MINSPTKHRYESNCHLKSHQQVLVNNEYYGVLGIDKLKGQIIWNNSHFKCSLDVISVIQYMKWIKSFAPMTVCNHVWIAGRFHALGFCREKINKSYIHNGYVKLPCPTNITEIKLHNAELLVVITIIPNSPHRLCIVNKLRNMQYPAMTTDMPCLKDFSAQLEAFRV